MPEPLGVTVTLAVKLTNWPNTDGLAEELTVVVVVMGLLCTVCENVPLLVRKLLSPA